MSVRVRVLFVCLGNICRSPVAEGVMRNRLRSRGLDHAVEVLSAGLGGWHVGERPDQRALDVAAKNGVALESRARKIDSDAFAHTDWIVCMDHQNRLGLEQIGAPQERVRLLKSYAPHPVGDSDEVDDPYQHGPEAFDRMFKEIAVSIDHMIDQLVAVHGLQSRRDVAPERARPRGSTSGSRDDGT